MTVMDFISFIDNILENIEFRYKEDNDNNNMKKKMELNLEIIQKQIMEFENIINRFADIIKYNQQTDLIQKIWNQIIKNID